MRIDLHTHTDRSDGTDSPTALVRRARQARIDVLGLTDHDTTASWDEAAEEAERAGITLVRGLEISCRHNGYGVHLLAYLPDPSYPPLAEELDRILDGRNARLPATLDRLRDLGIDIDAEDVRRWSGQAAAMGRPHVADALVEKGVVRDRAEAFDTYLGPGGPAYVNRYAAPLLDMLRMVTEAGGVSVVAHPWARPYHDALDEAGFAGLKRAGLAGIEVDHQGHPPQTRDALRSIADNLGLVATGSSDFHGTGKVGHELGCDTTDPGQYERLMSIAAAAAEASKRGTPIVVGR